MEKLFTLVRIAYHTLVDFFIVPLWIIQYCTLIMDYINTGPASYATDYFAQLGYNCPSQYNPCDYLLDIVSVDTRDEASKANSQTHINYLCTSWQNRDRSIGGE